MIAKTTAQLFITLEINKFHSRPHVSNDNPYSESQFKTLKYRPDFLDRFGSIEDALSFCCQSFFRWYNTDHHHSGLRMLTPEVVQTLPFSEGQRILFHIGEAMSWESVRNLAQMRNTLLLIENIAAQSEIPDEVAEWIEIVRENLDEPYIAFEEGKVF